MLIFSFFGQLCRVNNLATVGSITWPHFLQKIGKCGQVIDLTVFTWFFGITCSFCQKSHSPCRKKRIFEKKQKQQQKTIKKVAKLLTYGGQVIDPTAYIYIYTHIYIYIYIYVCVCPPLSLSISSSLCLSPFLFLSLSLSHSIRFFFPLFFSLPLNLSQSLSLSLSLSFFLFLAASVNKSRESLQPPTKSQHVLLVLEVQDALEDKQMKAWLEAMDLHVADLEVTAARMNAICIVRKVSSTS